MRSASDGVTSSGPVHFGCLRPGGSWSRYKPRRAVTDAGGPCGVHVVECGSRLGKWRRKCLHAAVLHLCPAQERERVRRRVLKFAANHGSSSLIGTEVERRNFEGLVGLLREARWQVKVAVVGSREAFARGEVRGVWQLGAAQGGSLGVLVWFESDEHVAVLKGPGTDSLLDSVPLGMDLVEAPWCCGRAGAPKKGAKRGAHFKKGGAGHTAR